MSLQKKRREMALNYDPVQDKPINVKMEAVNAAPFPNAIIACNASIWHANELHCVDLLKWTYFWSSIQVNEKTWPWSPNLLAV